MQEFIRKKFNLCKNLIENLYCTYNQFNREKINSSSVQFRLEGEPQEEYISSFEEFFVEKEILIKKEDTKNFYFTIC
jgi:hypothetical protein